VLAARLGSDGIVAQLRGAVDGPYPIGDVMVYVGEDDLDTAQELLLADEVEAAFDDADDDDTVGALRRSHWMTWMALAMLVSLWCAVMVRGI